MRLAGLKTAGSAARPPALPSPRRPARQRRNRLRPLRGATVSPGRLGGATDQSQPDRSDSRAGRRPSGFVAPVHPFLDEPERSVSKRGTGHNAGADHQARGEFGGNASCRQFQNSYRRTACTAHRGTSTGHRSCGNIALFLCRIAHCIPPKRLRPCTFQ